MLSEGNILAGRPLSLAEKMAADSRAQSDQIRARRELPTEGDALVTVINAHGGAVCGIEPNHTGKVNPRNSGVQGFIGAGMLILVDATDEKSVAARVNVDRDAELAAMREALSRSEAENAERLEMVNGLEARVRDLQHELTALHSHRERIAELEALVAQQRAEMDALTMPNAVNKAPDSPSKAPNHKR